MKKFFAICVAATALFLVACGGASTPSDAAVEIYSLMEKGDYEGVADSFYFGNKSAEEEAQGHAMILSLMKEKAAPMIEKKGGLKSYEAISESISEDGKSAKVELKVAYGNGTEETTKVDMVLDDKGDWKAAMKK